MSDTVYTYTDEVLDLVRMPGGYVFAIVAVFLLLIAIWNFVIVPAIEALIAVGERAQARQVYRDADYRRLLDAAARTNREERP